MTASPVKVVVQSLFRKGGLKLSKVQVCVVEKCMLIVIDCVEEFFEKKKEKKKNETVPWLINYLPKLSSCSSRR